MTAVVYHQFIISSSLCTSVSTSVCNTWSVYYETRQVCSECQSFKRGVNQIVLSVKII